MKVGSTPREVALGLAHRVRERRLRQNWTQEELAQRAGISVASYRRFEQTGKIALERLLLIASALHALGDFDRLLVADGFRSLDEIEDLPENSLPPRGRARKESQG